MRSSGSGSNSENARTGMSLKGKDNQTASEDVLKLAPQVLHCINIFNQHTLWTVNDVTGKNALGLERPRPHLQWGHFNWKDPSKAVN